MKIDFDSNCRIEVKAVYDLMLTLMQDLYPNTTIQILVPKAKPVNEKDFDPRRFVARGKYE